MPTETATWNCPWCGRENTHTGVICASCSCYGKLPQGAAAIDGLITALVAAIDRAERAEAANTQLREAAKTLLGYWEPPERGTKAYDYWEPPDGKTTRRILDDFRAALALDEEQENA